MSAAQQDKGRCFSFPSFGTKCPKLVPPLTWLGWYILQSRLLSHDGERAGGLGWTWTEVYLWTLPTVPMSAWWKRSRTKQHSPRRRHRKERLVRGVLIGGESAVFSATGNTLKERLMCEHLARKNALFARASGIVYWGGNMIICPARILLNTFHIFRSAGEQLFSVPRHFCRTTTQKYRVCSHSNCLPLRNIP